MDNDTLDLDLGSLTIDEIETIEEIIDGPFDEAFKPGAKKGRTLRALAYTVKRRTDPDITLEDVGRLKIQMGEKQVPPTDASVS